MVNNSEMILNAFSENFFFKENILSDLKYTPKGQTEVELADAVFVISKYIVAIQLKARNVCDQTDDVVTEEKWLRKKCKEAKRQVENTLKEIRSGKLPEFTNNRGTGIRLNKDSEIIPIVMFMNPTIKDYGLVLQKHSEDGYDINCISYEDFCEVCTKLISPREIIDYFKWRVCVFANNARAELFLFEDSTGMSLSRPMESEAAVGSFLHAKYGLGVKQQNSEYIEAFRYLLLNLKSRIVFETEQNADISIVRFFASLTRIEAETIVKRVERALESGRKGQYDIVGSIRNVEDKTVVFIVSSGGKTVDIDKLEKLAMQKMEVDVTAAVIVYWVDNNYYRLDFLLKRN